jgi:hypothetical protein
MRPGESKAIVGAMVGAVVARLHPEEAGADQDNPSSQGSICVAHADIVL